MSADDRRHWDARHAAAADLAWPTPSAPRELADREDLFPCRGFAIELACGRGGASVWLALRGMQVFGIDVSPVAIAAAVQLAEEYEVGHRCRFEVVDLDNGLPDTPPADLVLSHMFRDPQLDAALVDRLKPNAILAVACLSEVDHEPGRYRAPAGDLRRAFGSLDILDVAEANGQARIIARRS